MLIHNTIPLTLCNNLLTFPDTGKTFELKRDLFKFITNKNNYVDLSSLSDEKFLIDSAKEMYFHVKATVNKSTRDRSPINLLKSPSIWVSASGISTSNKNKSFSNKSFYQLILVNFVINSSYYYKKKESETFLT